MTPTIARLTRIACWLLLPALAACGPGADGGVEAIDLATGETRAYGSRDAVPEGWAACAADGCAAIPTHVPCGSLGEAVCERRPGCRLEQLWCSSPACPGSAGGEGSDGSAPADPLPGADSPCLDPTPTCEHACVEAGGGQPVDPPSTTVACPAVGPPPAGFCSQGQVVARYDATGCVTGFECFGGCPEVPTTTSSAPCPEGWLEVAVHDSQGCEVDRVCQREPDGCDQLAARYAAALALAAACAPDVVSAPEGQCSVEIADALGCGCPTRVNPVNGSALAELKTLQAQWRDLGCDGQVACPETAPCFVPMSASCQAGASGAGSCQSH